jgi:hypothetical protein
VAAGRIPVTVIVIGDRPIVGIPGRVVVDVDKTHFDNATDTWTVTTLAGEIFTARALVSTRISRDATVAVHGLPNYFRIPGPQFARQTKLVQRCLDLLARSGATRMEAKGRITLRRWPFQSIEPRFCLTGLVPTDDEVYAGPATVSLAGVDITAHANLAGHLDPIDGRYHWRGSLSGDLPEDVLKGQRAVNLSIDGHRVEARVVERTPWGGYTVTGVGAPPFALTK